MQVKSTNQYDLNVRVTVLDGDKQVVQQTQFKNTATKRMTDAIALFLAGDTATYARDTASAPRGRWRPNFMSFGTTGIDRQPTTANGLATILDPAAFEDKNPDEGSRTRPWFYSKCLGENADGFWNPEVGWSPREDGIADFQGELVTAMNPANEAEWADRGLKTISRQQILRSEVTTDYPQQRDASKESYSTDCILYGYASVLWVDQFFNPTNGPSIPRLAISELGLYEYDSNTPYGNESLMAGFRVPKVEDILYVEPGFVILVEWRITISALMPYQQIGGGGGCTGTNGKSPYIHENGNWFEYNDVLQTWIDTEVKAEGIDGAKGDKGDKGDTVIIKCTQSQYETWEINGEIDTNKLYGIIIEE